MKRVSRRFLSFVLPFVLLSAGLPAASPAQKQDQRKPDLKTTYGDGHIRRTFQFPNGGKLRVYLPDDLISGDTISGTIAIELPSQGPAAAADGLNEAVVEIGTTGVSARVKDRGVTFRVPTLPKGGELPMVIRDQNGKELASAGIPVGAPPLATVPGPPQPSGFELPRIAQAGQLFAVHGPFDGDMANTVANIGEAPAELIAESPRQAVFRSPGAPVGESELQILERGTYAAGLIRNVAIGLTASKLNLRKGETSDVQIAVSGLTNLSEPVEVSVECGGTVEMQGGNQQVLRIGPNDVGPNGISTNKRTLVGISAGGFFVNATVLAKPALQAPCPMKDRIVHVENVPGGGDGLWIVPITLTNGSRRSIFIRSEKKPNLKFCDWIEIKTCETRNGTTTVTDYKLTNDPTIKPPVKPDVPPKPTETPKPSVPSDTGVKVPVDTPCKNGETRNLKEETKEFEIMTLDSRIDLTVEKSTDGAINAAMGLSGFWKAASAVGGLVTDRLPEGSTVAGWVLGYLDRGSEILDAVANSSLKNTAKEINIRLGIGTKKITATCIRFEVCVNGKWLKKSILKTTSRESAYQKSLKISFGDANWNKIEQTSKPQMFDPQKLDQFVKDWLKEQINVLKGSEDAYNEFVKNCR